MRDGYSEEEMRVSLVLGSEDGKDCDCISAFDIKNLVAGLGGYIYISILKLLGGAEYYFWRIH